MTTAGKDRGITYLVNGLTAAVLVLGGGIAWGTLSSKADQNAEDIDKLESTIVQDSQKIEDIRVDSTETKVRLRQVEKEIEDNSRKLDIILREIRQQGRDDGPNQR